MDFYKIVEKELHAGEDKGMTVVTPIFRVQKSKDLMIRAKSFYAVWNEEKGLWDTDEYSLARMIDDGVEEYMRSHSLGSQFTIAKKAADFNSGVWKEFRKYVAHLSDNYHLLDDRITFINTPVERKDYVSRHLSYAMEEGSIEAYEELVSTLYDPAERQKLEWAIGSIIAGDSKRIQKFLVLYGQAGAGKSTMLNIIQKLFDGYYAMFDAKALTSTSNAFATEAFKTNPLVAIQHDGDLSHIETNTLLNSIVSHEEILVNEKYKPGYPTRINAFLFMGTNKPVKITDAKSGVIRRLIDVVPSGRLLPTDRYHMLVSLVDFELGAIAKHCLEVYRSMGKDYYSAYRPEEMILQTDVFYNFIEYYYEVFSDQDGTTLAHAYDLYKHWCDDSNIEFKLPRHKFREELRNYFKEFRDREMIEGERVRSVYRGFLTNKFQLMPPRKHAFSLTLDEDESLLDHILANSPAQYANDKETPTKKWQDVETVLSDLDTSRLHYVKMPENHIVIDFDLKDDNGAKSLERNLAAASSWPSTYAEFSKSGEGVHLHYLWEGDARELSRIYDDGIEIKVFVGDSSLRRRLSKCNNVPVAKLTSGLPLKEKKVLDMNVVKSERGLRTLIERNLRKEIHPGTKPSIDFIHKILEDAYSSGMSYSLLDMRPAVLAFAMKSTNQSEYCLELVSRMKFQSEHCEPAPPEAPYNDDRLVFFDVEVFPNLLHISWKYQGSATVVHLVNPEPADIEPLLKMKLVGYNNRRYDNHILYARYLGKSIPEIFLLSQALIVDKSPNATFMEAYNISYVDVYDYLSTGNKKSLKRWQVELDLTHKELGLPWDQHVPEELWAEVGEYCDNDVVSLEAVFFHTDGDFEARKMLARLSGLPINSSTNTHSARIIFGDNKKPQGQFVYTDLSEMFPGYTYDFGKSYYRGELVGEGGYVYSKPGMYNNVGVLDVASMHPTSIELLNLFGDEYTEKFSSLKQARLYIKHKDPGKAAALLGIPIDDTVNIKALSDALKTVINSVYGLTSAHFDNPFRDLRNKDNIVAKRGALFMIDLKNAVQDMGVEVIHIKTDSIKIPDITPEIVDFIMEFGKKYGYEFEHETTYEKMCLVNDAVYIAKDHGEWTATGAQFAHPYVFKKLFSHEPIEFKDLCETKAVTTAFYLDFSTEIPMFEEAASQAPQYVGRVGQFTPIKPGCGGGVLLREKDGKYYSASSAKGFFWMESEMVKALGKEDDIDMLYFTDLVDKAYNQISKYGDPEQFLD